MRFLTLASQSLFSRFAFFWPKCIAVGGGGGGGGGGQGGGRPPIRFKTSKIRASSLFIWANSLFIWAHHWQKNRLSFSEDLFFFWRTP